MENQNPNPRVGIGVLIQNEKGEVLLGLRKGSHGAGEWCFPGGHLDFGETVFETAKREVKEETGMDVQEMSLISVADELRYIKSENKHYINIGVKAKHQGDQPRLMEPDKCQEWRWFDLNNLPAENEILEGTALVIRNFKKSQIYEEGGIENNSADDKKIDRLSKFFYEVGNLRKIIRSHQQTILANDPSDNISSHSFRVAMIGYFLAKELEADADKVLKMCLIHDIAEVRSSDMNWVHKKYVKVYEDEITQGQLNDLPHSEEFIQLSSEYEKRESLEAKIAKDADLLDQVFLLNEYAHQGYKEAEKWLHLENSENCQQIKRMNFDLTKKIANKAIKQLPSDWWQDIWTSDRR